MVFPTPDQKAGRLAKLLVEEVVPFCGVPDALLSDRGTNLLSHLMVDVCRLLGTKKLNTTSYHPQCDGMVERFNRTLKTSLRKYAIKFGDQWDTYLAGLLWAYRNTPHVPPTRSHHFSYLEWTAGHPVKQHYFPPILLFLQMSKTIEKSWCYPCRKRELQQELASERRSGDTRSNMIKKLPPGSMELVIGYSFDFLMKRLGS